MLCGALQIVNALSAFLRNENLDFTDVPHRVDDAVNKLHILIDQLGDRGNKPTYVGFPVIYSRQKLREVNFELQNSLDC
jgi:hypothetical protein